MQDGAAVNLWERRGVAVREFSLKPGHGEADYLLFADRQAVGVVEAKPEGATLTGVAVQSGAYGEGLPEKYKAPFRPLPFLYESTGVETRFTNGLDPEPRSQPIFAFHRPETLAGVAVGVNRPRPSPIHRASSPQPGDGSPGSAAQPPVRSGALRLSRCSPDDAAGAGPRVKILRLRSG